MVRTLEISLDSYEATRGRTDGSSRERAWIAEVPGILPLSALIEFIDIPEKLHIFQLTGAVPLWSWPIAPSGSRLLLSDQYTEQECYFDRYGKSMSLLALDGQYGDNFTVRDPETVRQCLATETPRIIRNLHEIMSRTDPGIQNLEFVYVVRLTDKESHRPAPTWLSYLFIRHGASTSLQYLVVSTFGWAILFGMIAMSVMLGCYPSLAFFATALGAGLVTFMLYGCQPRRLLVPGGSIFNRLAVVTEHVYSAKWTVFYGESAIANSLLYRPLEHDGPQPSHFVARCLFMVLRILILGQWALVIGAAAFKGWDAYFTTFWITFCIKRFSTKLSSFNAFIYGEYTILAKMEQKKDDTFHFKNCLIQMASIL